jgi:hypothetical protein
LVAFGEWYLEWYPTFQRQRTTRRPSLRLDEVGFSDHSVAGNYAMVQPEISRGKTWPVRLDPRDKAILYSTDGTLLPERVWSNPCAYAKTDCGSCFYGKSPILSEAKAKSVVA